jgi:hypothetical protein
MTKKKPVIERAAECQRLIERGMSLREACKKADIDDKTFKRNLPQLESLAKEEREMLSKPKESLENVMPTHPNVPVTFKDILIRVPIEDYNYLMEEKRRTGVAPSTNAAKVVREWIYQQKTKK